MQKAPATNVSEARNFVQIAKRAIPVTIGITRQVEMSVPNVIEPMTTNNEPTARAK